MTRPDRFTGRTVLVTGSTGMAAGTARALAADGAQVFVVSRTAEHAEELKASIEKAGGVAGSHTADVADESQVESAVGACVALFGRIDAAYTVAGISGRRYGDGPLHEATLDGWQSVMTSNATSTFLVARAVVRQMLAQPRGASGSRGAILTMSSVLATRPSPGFFGTHGYAASKGAVEALTRSAAAYYAPHGIRFNVIAPALVATRMSRRAQEDRAIVEYLREKQPLARGVMEVDDTVATALYLLSDDARGVTGQVIAVDGGWGVSEPRSGGAGEPEET